MREFVDGNQAQFDDLKQKLQDGLCHVFKNCELPACCSKRICRIGFEKRYDVYAIMIDMGITCFQTEGGIQLLQFKQLLSEGELMFLDFNDLRVFLKSLEFLYHEEVELWESYLDIDF